MRWHLQPLPSGAVPGLSPALRRHLAGEELPTATPVLRRLSVPAQVGPVWTDAAFLAERRDALARMQAPASATQALERLATGRVAVVVTGQQPGVLGGPMMSVLKVLGAVAWAEAFTRAGTPCVAVYWCGADDSDFAETRAAWVWSASRELYRAALPAAMWRPGQRVGDLRGPELAAVERAALAQAGRGPGAGLLQETLESIPSDLDFGERAEAWLLRLLAGRPLVTVDARSPRLRGLGRELMEAYARRHHAIFDQLSATTRALEADGWSPPLALEALRSGLFTLGHQGRRRKLAPEELTAGLGDHEPTPSVMLRPVWQDALLAPLASVLGPAELAYHLQLAPLYRELDVQAAAPVPRPHLVDWPTGLPWPAGLDDLPGLLVGGAAARDVLRRWAWPEEWSAPLARMVEQRQQARGELESRLPNSYPQWAHQDDELHRRWRSDLAERALARRLRADPVWGWAPRWLAPRQLPQERVLAATVGWWRWGEQFDAILSQLAEHYVRAVGSRTSPAFVVREDPAS